MKKAPFKMNGPGKKANKAVKGMMSVFGKKPKIKIFDLLKKSPTGPREGRTSMKIGPSLETRIINRYKKQQKQKLKPQPDRQRQPKRLNKTDFFKQ